MGRRAFSPVDSLTEVLAGVVMALTVSVSVYTASGRAIPQRELVEAVLGCNLAWGIFDGLLFVVAQRASRARRTKLREALRTATSDEAARRVLGEELDEALTPFVDVVGLRAHLAHAEADASDPHRLDVWRGGVSLGLLETVSAVPVILPLVLMARPQEAIWVSSALGVLLMAVAGWRVARWNGQPVLLLGVLTPLLGALLVVACLWLGG
jgi:VIT1/CCC1 family predicted Fe2+/Mn2+ transporter